MLAVGDFTQRVEGRFSGRICGVAAGYQCRHPRIQQYVTVVKHGAEQTRDTANKNREFADTLAAQVQVQSGAMNTLAATVTEMEHAIQDVNSNTEASLGMGADPSTNRCNPAANWLKKTADWSPHCLRISNIVKP
jgi:methyl-accepting chemotaxis protein